MQTIASLDPSTLAFGPKKPGVKMTEAHFVPVILDSKPVHVQLTTSEDEALRVPFGLSSFFEDGDKKRALSLECTDALLQWAEALDRAVKQAAVANSKEWFGRKLKEADILEMYTPLVHTVVSYAGEAFMLRTKVIVEGPMPTVLVAPPDFGTVGVDALVPGTVLLPIAKISEVWFMEVDKKEKFGVTLNLTQAVVWPPKAPSLHNFVGLTLPQ